MKYVKSVFVFTIFLSFLNNALASDCTEFAPTSIENTQARDKFLAECMQIFDIVGNELEHNGINTGFIVGDDEPNLETVKKSMPSDFDLTTKKNQNLLNLALYQWQFKKLSDDCLKISKALNFIDFAPIEKVDQGELEDSYNRVIKYLFQDVPRDKIMTYLGKSDKYLQLSGPLCLLDDSKNPRGCAAIQVEGPLLISDSQHSHYILYWEQANPNVLGHPLFLNYFYKNVLSFLKIARKNFYDTRYLDEKNISNIAANNFFLNSLYTCYQNAKSARIYAFDPTTKYIPEDIINDEAKRQIKISYHGLKAEYYQNILNDDIQAKLEFEMIKENARKYAWERCPTKAALKAHVRHQYKKNHEQMERLHLGLASLAELYHNAIFNKMEENKKYLESIFDPSL